MARFSNFIEEVSNFKIKWTITTGRYREVILEEFFKDRIIRGRPDPPWDVFEPYIKHSIYRTPG